ncbi:Mitochondrial import inner membrane translocase subunit TIM10 [Golovinomyces cichoracearum]|uniref:Mitochondrial import inner membrane translocase subunit n=1 Tax=Golovinomyces cichoracearum TaxID=62708 RepID=A0A420IWP4_9PEZI|nr:Mitochondrial import inner membrane translocase subunit TIM10 [Golovinomyces cichoracearum]
MSMFGFGRPQPSSAEKIAAAEQEMDMVTDMFNKLQKACMKKCVPQTYREGELNKGEGVCIDRCSAKFFDVQLKVSELLQSEAAAKGAKSASSSGLGFGV